MKLLFAIIMLAAACDPSAKASGEGGALADEQRSQLGESCGTSLHCASGLRCLDQVCRAAKASTIGEFHAAAGDTAMARKDVMAAIEHYTQAVNQFEADKIDPPAQLLCALGGALAQDRDDRTNGELSARMLHKCLLGAPAGSSLRRTAMRHLSLLSEVGLDPLLLARSEPADAYLTKQAAAPALDKLSVTATAQGRAPGSRTYKKWIDELSTPAVKAALAPCWEAYFKETREPRLTVQLSFKYSYRLDDYEDFERSTLDIDEVAVGSDPISKAHSCARTVLSPIADDYSRGGFETKWNAVLNITIGE